jgi:two-component system, LytTR family, sensor kinase
LARSPLSVSKFRYAFFGWWLVWSALHAILILSLGYPLNVATLDSAVMNVQVLGACWLISNIMKYYLPKSDQYWYFIILSIGLSGLITYDAKQILSNVLSDQPEYLSMLTSSLAVRLGVSFLLISCMVIVCLLWYTTEEENENRQRKSDTEKLAKEAELFKLRQQLQPHFLFNSLNSISALVSSQPEQARKMIQQLSDFLRGTIKKEDQQWATLSDELQYLELYLDIEKVRFGYRLTTVIEATEMAKDSKVPPMLLQPIVENAIKFGLYDTTEAVTIRIEANLRDPYLELIVVNPFDSETAHPKKGTGFGLNSLKRRLYLLFARNDLLETTSENNLFRTIVKIPQTL